MMGSLLDALAAAILAVLRPIHGWVGSWPLALVILALLVHAISRLLLPRLMPDRKLYLRMTREFPDAESRTRAIAEGRLAPLPMWHFWPLMGLQLLDLLLRVAPYLMLGAVVARTQTFDGVPLWWIPDLASRDPLYLLPLVPLAFFAGAVLLLRRTAGRPPVRGRDWLRVLVLTALALVSPAVLAFYYLVRSSIGNGGVLVAALVVLWRRRATRSPAHGPQ